MRRLLLASPLLVLIGCAVGCATVSKWFSGNATILNDTVIIAVDVAEGQGITAAQIHRIASFALAADSGTGGTLAALSNLVNAQIAAAHLPPTDQAAISVFEVALSAAISAKIGNNATVAATQAAVADVLKDVIAATS
jgi:hypothetical protein